METFDHHISKSYSSSSSLQKDTSMPQFSQEIPIDPKLSVDPQTGVDLPGPGPVFNKCVLTPMTATPTPCSNQYFPTLLSCTSSTVTNAVFPTRAESFTRHPITKCYIFPTSAPLFPTTFVPNYKVTNPEQQNAIVFCGIYNLKIGLFYVKDTNWNSNDSITSSCDIYHRGVIANIAGYKFIDSDDAHKSQRLLVVNLRVLYNVEIDNENFFIPVEYGYSRIHNKKDSVDSSFTKTDISWMADMSHFGDMSQNTTTNSSSLMSKSSAVNFYDSFYKDMELFINLLEDDRSKRALESTVMMSNRENLSEEHIKKNNCFANLITVTTKFSRKHIKDLQKSIIEVSDRIYHLYSIAKQNKNMTIFIRNSRQKMRFCNSYIQVKRLNSRSINIKNEKVKSLDAEANDTDMEFLVFKFYALLDILKMFFHYFFIYDISRLRFFMGVFQDINDKRLLSERVDQALKLVELAINVSTLNN